MEAAGRACALVRIAGRIAVLVLLAATAGCGSSTDRPPPAQDRSTDAKPPRGGTAVLGSISDVDSWNEYLSRQDFAGKLHRRIFLRLAVERGDGQDGPQSFEPLLAGSWEFSEDGMSLTFTLREAQWSDGRPVLAEDVRFTWQAQTAADVAWANATTKQHITDVEILEPHRVRFHFDRRYAHQLADAVEGGILPRHVFGEIPFEDWRTHDWSGVSVGSGPFVLERHRPADEIVLRRNPNYFRKGFPRLDRVVIRIVPDAGNLLTQLLAGDIDYFEGVAPREAHRLAAGDEVSVVSFDYPKYDYVGWNGAKAPFDDPRVRRALTLAIDREALVEDLLYGYGRVSKGPVLSFSWGADRELEPWPHDPGEARRILANAGYATLDEDGRQVGSGETLEIELLTNAGNKLREAMAVKIQAQLAAIGVRVTLRTLEMRTMIGRCMKGDYDAYLGGWTLLGKVDLKPVFGSEFKPPKGANVVFFESPEVDRQLQRLDDAEDWQTMKPVLNEIQQSIHREQPYTFLYETKRVAVMGPRLAGFEIGNPADPLAGLERCWVRGS